MARVEIRVDGKLRFVNDVQATVLSVDDGKLSLTGFLPGYESRPPLAPPEPFEPVAPTGTVVDGLTDIIDPNAVDPDAGSSDPAPDPETTP
ncbi:hypothetical protein [Mycolicibacterium sphagni]|uniref:hypothetical protein n=1 Tax=Mycolicibacterium sphagni TaxID=1786 RepID=UPI0021F36153|nr:hypothetical protein [Mycolicibacterium sphagni]MCV7174769.1 hypothetical protein [Mycolicibacterium sphagni]